MSEVKMIDLNANVHVKKNGLKTGSALDFRDVKSSFPDIVTKRMVWRLLLQISNLLV